MGRPLLSLGGRCHHPDHQLANANAAQSGARRSGLWREGLSSTLQVGSLTVRESGDVYSLAQALTARNPKTPTRGGSVSPRLLQPKFKSQAAKTNASMSMHDIVQSDPPSFLGLRFPPIGRREVGFQRQLAGEMALKFTLLHAPNLRRL